MDIALVDDPFEDNVPPLKVSVPVPTALLTREPELVTVSTPASNTPLVSVVPPLYVFAPVRVNVAPFTVRATVPPLPALFLITPAYVVVPPVTVSVEVVGALEFKIVLPEAPVNDANVWLLP